MRLAPYAMSVRLPALSYARDSEFYRQRIQREHRARERWDPGLLGGSSLPRTPQTSNAAYTRTLHTPHAMERPFATYVIDPVGPTPVLVGHRNEITRRELTSKPWCNPPLIMAKGWHEPPRMFRNYLEASTSSASRPMVPVLSWKA